MKKKNNKSKIFMGLSILIICFLISASSLNITSTNALVEEKNNQYNTDSTNGFIWELNTTEVVSTESSGKSYHPSQTIDSIGNVHVTWDDQTAFSGSGSDYDIFYKKWNKLTSSWTTTEVVSTGSTLSSANPSIAVDDAWNVHIAWEDLTTGYWEIFYRRWNASTFSWTATEVVSTESIVAAFHPSLAVDTLGNVHIAWQDSGGNYDIWYKCWNASISTWTTTEVVSTESTTESGYPALTTDAVGNIHVTWHDLTNYLGAGTEYDIFYKRRDASTSLWTTTEVVSTESTANSIYPALTTDAAGIVHIVWQDSTNYTNCGTDSDIFYKYWNASISSWTATEVVSTESTGTSFWPSLDTDAAGKVNIVWQDSTDYAGNGTDWDIFYKNRDTSSFLWTMTEVVSTESTGDSYYPSINVGDTGCDYHVVWYDTTDYEGAGADIDIFYKGTTVDFSSPSIDDVTYFPSEPTFDDQITISATVTDNVEVHNVTLYYNVDGGSWFSASMIASETIYSVIIGPFAAGSTIDYYLIAYDISGNSAQSSIMDFEIAPIVEEFGIISSLILGTLAISVVIMKIRKKNSKPN
ncbi:MAG: hypothetical protein GOP50_10400 [Candidatus Heimdallarchaeota archaeon]|nr:hypothetical protein [Candidatus Heimdallarchaeota archaeon]